MGRSGDEGVKRGQALDDNEIRPKGEAANNGWVLGINVETGEDERDADDGAAAKRAKTRFRDAPLFSMRVGFRAAHESGAVRGAGPIRLDASQPGGVCRRG